MSYQSEAQLENELMVQLESQGWQKVSLPDYSDLENNFRDIFNSFNWEVLTQTPLTDAEFRRVLAQIKDRGVFESAKLLRDKQQLTRDDGSTVTYSLFNTKEWCKNKFQVAQQVRTKGSKWKTRYDVTLLINGLPLIQIELKKSGVEIAQAFNQISRYKEDNAYQGLFNFIQFFITSNGVYTRYFANNEKKLSKSFAFKWTDEHNNQYESLAEFASHFLDKCWAAKMIARYMVVQEAERRLIIMRPYQVHGTEKMVNRALHTGNSGFIWHTTGSGKTLTSFKVSRILAESGKFKKVFFLVDRRDLNKQTSEEFNRFQEGSISTTDNTYGLVQKIKSIDLDDRLILTTMHKLSNAVQNPAYKADMSALANESVVFVIDECHRTQYGDMQMEIRKYFKNAQYFGFTGTPLFAENASTSEKTTTDVFSECLHTYLLKDGIRDKNTLPFSVEYVSTFTLKEEVEDPDEKFKGVRKEEVWHNPDRVARIVDDIFIDRKRKSPNPTKAFNAMLTVDSVKAIALYMEAFQKKNLSLPEGKRLTVATVYSFGENGDPTAGFMHPKDTLDGYIGDYNERFGTNFSLADVGRYTNDVADKFKKGDIDVLIVVAMMLTGFDSQILNTLYVDKPLKHHTLIQAYSRTNRVLDGKPEGHIRCYRNLKEETDAAVRLFSNITNVSDVLAKPYDEQRTEFENAVNIFKQKYSKPADLLRVESELEKKDFVLCFRALAKKLRRIETFSEFNWDDFNISHQNFKDYETHYLEFKPDSSGAEGEKVSILNDIDFQLEQVLTDLINVDYIFRLLGELDADDKASVKKLRDMVAGGQGTDKLRKKRDLLIEFIDNVVPLLFSGTNLKKAYHDFLDERTREEVENRAVEFGISAETLLTIVSTYRFQGKFDGDKFDEETTLPAQKQLRGKKALKDFVTGLAETFNTEE